MDYSKQYCLKLVKYGNHYFEWFEYELPLLINDKRKIMNSVYSDEQLQEKSVNRAKKRIKELCLCNPSMNKFVTLTFKNILDYNNQVRQFKQYIKRLKRRFKFVLRYLCVPEYGSRFGRFHFHYLANQPYIQKSELENIWGQGFVHVEFIDDPYRASDYISKYMSKDLQARVSNRKLYFASKSLSQPEVFRDEEALDYYQKNNLLLQKVESYNHSFLGVINKYCYIKN